MIAPRPPREPVSPARRARLGALHQAAAKLHLDDEAYRDRLQRDFGVRSARDLSDAQLDRAISMFHGKPAAAHHPHTKKVLALWIALANLGAVDPSDAALDAFVQRQTGKHKLAFVAPDESASLVEALKAMCAREGFAVEGDEKKVREKLLQAQWKKMHALSLSNGDLWSLDNYVTKKYLTFTGCVSHMTVEQLDDCAKAFGARIRGRLRAQARAAA